ncbi:hypothetical protein V5799_008635, partial [Amblyomma americanum]
MRAKIKDRVVYSPFPTMEIPCCSFYQAAKEALLKDPDKPALADGTALVTRRELLVHMQRYAAGFQKHGLGAGHRVCVHVENGVDNFAAMWGCVFAGASVVLARASLTERELCYQLRDSESTHVLTEPALVAKTAQAAASLQIKEVLLYGSGGRDPRECVLAICYTSGTTGLPKGAVTTHHGFLANMATAGHCFTWDESDVVLYATPVMHGSGFFCVTIGVLLGATAVVTSLGPRLERVSDIITKYKVTALAFLPFHLRSLAAEMQKTGNRLAGIRRICVGGGEFTEADRKAAQAAFGDVESVANLYAMTESMGIFCSPSNYVASGSDVGFPAPHSQIKVVDMVTRQKLGPYETGEICFRTPTVIKEYYKRPKETAEFFEEDGWCKSGDAGYYDEDGRLYVVQRLKEMIKCMDKVVVPAELEELILQEHSEHVSEVAVVGLPDPKYGEAPAAAVVLKDVSGSEGEPARVANKIKATIKDNLAVHKKLYGGVFVFNSLLKTQTGK